jgi:hypothetical protein
MRAPHNFPSIPTHSWSITMALDKTRLRDHLVFLEIVEARQVDMDAPGYLAAAQAVRRAIEHELGKLPMRAFVSDVLPTLQVTAQNVFFDSHRRFADLDGSGHALQAQALADGLLRRLRQA